MSVDGRATIDKVCEGSRPYLPYLAVAAEHPLAPSCWFWRSAVSIMSCSPSRSRDAAGSWRYQGGEGYLHYWVVLWYQYVKASANTDLNDDTGPHFWLV